MSEIKTQDWRKFFFDGNLAYGMCEKPEDLEKIKETYKNEAEYVDIMEARMWEEEDTPTFRFDGKGIKLKEWLSS